MNEVRRRPRCGRCGGPLDLWDDPKTGVGLVCNNPVPVNTDEDFWHRWNDLPADDIAGLLRQIS